MFNEDTWEDCLVIDKGLTSVELDCYDMMSLLTIGHLRTIHITEDMYISEHTDYDEYDPSNPGGRNAGAFFHGGLRHKYGPIERFLAERR